MLSWFSSECVLRVLPTEMPGGPLTVAEMYFASCAPEDQEVYCSRCEKNTIHDSQTRMFTAPNVLVVQVRRVAGVRVPVAVEEQLDVPGLPTMELIGVVYHNGESLVRGHYTCLCRGPGGRFWLYDDSKPVSPMNKELSHIKPREVYMVVDGSRDGSAV